MNLIISDTHRHLPTWPVPYACVQLSYHPGSGTAADRQLLVHQGVVSMAQPSYSSSGECFTLSSAGSNVTLNTTLVVKVSHGHAMLMSMQAQQFYVFETVGYRSRASCSGQRIALPTRQRNWFSKYKPILILTSIIIIIIIMLYLYSTISSNDQWCFTRNVQNITNIVHKLH